MAVVAGTGVVAGMGAFGSMRGPAPARDCVPVRVMCTVGLGSRIGRWRMVSLMPGVIHGVLLRVGSEDDLGYSPGVLHTRASPARGTAFAVAPEG